MGVTGVVFGGPSPEHDISILTGLQAARTLQDAGNRVVCLYWSKSGDWVRVPADLEASAFLDASVPGAVPAQLAIPGGFLERRRLREAPIELDAVLNCCHGGAGEDGTLAGMLHLAGLHVTGPSPEASALAMDKLACTAVAQSCGIPAIPTIPLTTSTVTIELPRPWIVKPRYGGSSIGVEAGIEDVDTARALLNAGPARAGAVLQSFLAGWVDLNVAVRTYPEPQVSAVERPLRSETSIYGYRDKYLTGRGIESAPRELPAKIPNVIAAEIKSSALRLADVMRLTGAPRIDFLWDGADQVLFCEINGVPGALGVYLWLAEGVSRIQILEALLEEARALGGRRPHWAPTSDGAALRVAGTVASKLA